MVVNNNVFLGLAALLLATTGTMAMDGRAEERSEDALMGIGGKAIFAAAQPDISEDIDDDYEDAAANAGSPEDRTHATRAMFNDFKQETTRKFLAFRQDLDNTKADLLNTSLDLHRTRIDLEKTTLDLETTKGKLAIAEGKLEIAEAERAVIENELQTVKGQLLQVHKEAADAKEAEANAKIKIASIQVRLQEAEEARTAMQLRLEEVNKEVTKAKQAAEKARDDVRTAEARAVAAIAAKDAAEQEAATAKAVKDLMQGEKAAAIAAKDAAEQEAATAKAAKDLMQGEKAAAIAAKALAEQKVVALEVQRALANHQIQSRYIMDHIKNAKSNLITPGHDKGTAAERLVSLITGKGLGFSLEEIGGRAPNLEEATYLMDSMVDLAKASPEMRQGIIRRLSVDNVLDPMLREHLSMLHFIYQAALDDDQEKLGTIKDSFNNTYSK